MTAPPGTSYSNVTGDRMTGDFMVAKNPDPDSSLPYLLLIPLGDQPIVLKARDMWPRTGKVYCHRADGWPHDAEIVEQVPVRSCVRRGAAIDLVLDRGRENRSQLVMAQAKGRQVIFWQTARTAKQARPNVAVPSARAHGVAELEIIVDSHERYAYSFKEQQVTTRRAALVAGDYGIVQGEQLFASVERKSMSDLVGSLTGGKLRYQLSDLAALPHAALVVEDRYAEVFRLAHVRPAVVLDGLAECQIRYPNVPIVFCDTRQLAQEWTYRFLAAAWHAAQQEDAAEGIVAGLATASAVPSAPPRRRTIAAGDPSPAEVRAWAVSQGYVVSDRGRVKRELISAFLAARSGAAAQDEPERGGPHSK